MNSNTSRTARNVVIGLMACLVLPAMPVRRLSQSASLTLDGVNLVVQAAALPSAAFIVAEPGSAAQIASATDWEPFRELSILAVPFGEKPVVESLPRAAAGARGAYASALRSYRLKQGGRVQDAPTAMLFGTPVTGSRSIVSLFVDGPRQKTVLIDEWVVEAGARLWVVRASQEQPTGGSAPQPAPWSDNLSISSEALGAPSTLLAESPSGPSAALGPTAAGDLPVPTWWDGDCDSNTYLAKAGRASYRLGYVYLGMPACGPRPWADGAPDVLVRFFSGGWGVLEWECVELSMRFMYLMYGISPYGGNGSQVVWNYAGTRLVKVANGTVGQAPLPNDVLSYGATSTFGHTAVVTASSVDASGNGSITVIEENAASSGKSTLTVTGWRVGGNAGSVSGWLHDNTGQAGRNLNVFIAGSLVGTYYVPSGGRVTPQYGVQNGPLRVATSDASSVFSSERVHNANGFINEAMGVPTGDLTTEYWFPWYDNRGMASSILLGNPSAIDMAHVTVSIAGTDYGPYNVWPGSVISRQYPVMDGPVHITSDVAVFASERVATGQGFVQETMGYPNNQLTNEYWFPWYDNLGMISWILVGNPSDSADAHVTINIAGTDYGPYTIARGDRITPQFPVMNGPVHITSDINVFASERVHGINGFVQETMGYPASKLSNNYWFPWYDNLGMISWILVGNPSASAHAHVTINIAGTDYGPYTIGPGDRITPQFGVMNGPVHVTSDINVFTSERVHTGQGFVQETMGYPNNKLTTEYWYPWYDNVNTAEWALVGRP